MQTWSQVGRSRLAVGLFALALVALVFGVAVPKAHAAPPGPSITINNATATESSCRGVRAIFTVQLSRQSQQVVSVSFATASGSAISGVDYQAQSGVLTFQPRERSKTIPVPILADQITEDPETFVVNLSNPTNGTITDSQGVGQILNDLCDDADTCTTDSCDPASLDCQYAVVSCDDNNICTSDACDPSAGCEHQAIDLGQTTCGTGACERTVSVCVGGVPQTCTPGTPTAEVCNGLDDDCNGAVDGPGSEASCAFANATATCTGGACVIAACNAGFDDCDGSPANGCETGVSTDTSNCGACGNVCSFANAGAACSAGTCTLGACNAGYDNCDGNPANGCESPLNTQTNCGACGNTCSGNSTCAASGGSYFCECNPGYEGADCDDINECVTNNGGCSPNATCTNTPGSFTCSCNAGWEGDGVTCTDTDECLSNNGGCDPAHGTCHNQVGAPRTCTCDDPAWQGPGSDGIVCTDTDECLASPCGANTMCSNTPGSFVCTCIPNYGDCDGSPANGCENDLSASPNCGSCGIDCDAGLSNCEHSNCLQRSCQSPIDNAGCLAPTGADIKAGYCAFAEANCPSAIDSDRDGLSDTWENNGFIDVNCNGFLDANDVLLPDANKSVKDVYLKIAWMAGAPAEPPATQTYSAPDTTVPGCPVTSYVEDAEGHKPRQDSIDFVVRAFAGAHLKPTAQPCGKNTPGGQSDSPCPSGFTCVDFVCLPNCQTDADCAASCNADCQALDDARCVPWGIDPNEKVCRVWRLHVDMAAVGVVHHDIVSFGDVPDTCANTTGGGSMTPHDQANYFDYKAANFDSKEAAFKHWMLFGHDNTCYGTGSPGCGDASCLTTELELAHQQPQPGTTGVSEIKGNDSIVSLGVYQLQNAPTVRVMAEAGAIMHELGHNLGLDHSGPHGQPQDMVTKVNYMSVMNYWYQNTGIPFTNNTDPNVFYPLVDGYRPDYSHIYGLPIVPPGPLYEDALSETAGYVLPKAPHTDPLIKYVCDAGPINCGIDICTDLPRQKCFQYASGDGRPIDWDCDLEIDTGTVAADINGNGIEHEIHIRPAGDWINLFYEFQCQNSYANGAPLGVGQVASVATEQPYNGIRFDLTPPLNAPPDVQSFCLDVPDDGVVPATLDVTKD